MRGADRAVLRRRGQPLKASLQVGRQGPTATFLEEVRAELRRHPLLKVRLQAEDAEESQAQAETLAAALPAQLVEIRGRTVLLARLRVSAAPVSRELK